MQLQAQNQAEVMDLRYGGKCQRHGVLIVLADDQFRTVCQISENCDTALGYTAPQLLGQPIDIAFDEMSVCALRTALERPNETPDWRSLSIRSPRTGLRWDCAIHRPPARLDDHMHMTSTDQMQVGHAVLELEPFVQSDTGDNQRWGRMLESRSARAEGAPMFEQRIPLCPLAAVRTVIDRLNVLSTEEALCNEISVNISRLLDFERVLVYKFCSEGHGRVVGEYLEPGASVGLESFIGLNFPETDIPPSARNLFYEGRVRLIPDASDCGVDIVPAVNPFTHKLLDMTFCNLRAASKCCNQYHRNVDSMSQLIFSVIVQGKLWGLVTAHCRFPRFVPRSSRAAFVPIIQVFSKCLELLSMDRRRAAELRVKSLSLEMFSRMAKEPDDFASMLGTDLQRRQSPPIGAIEEVVECCGAANVQNGRVTTWGVVPSVADILTLLDLMKSLPPLVIRGERRDHLSCTPTELQTGAYSQLCAGNTRGLWLVNSASKELDNRSRASSSSSDDARIEVAWMGGFIATAVECGHLFWFRRAKTQEVRWAGDIAEPYVLRDGVLEARASFEIWKQLVADRCEPWTESDLSAVAGFTLAVRSAFLLAEAISTRRSFDALVSETRCNGIAFLSAQDEMIRVLGSLPVPLFAVCRDGLVRFWSSKMVDVTGVSADEAAQRPFLESLQPTAESTRTVLVEVLSKANLGYTTAGVEVSLASRTKSRKVEVVVCVAPLHVQGTSTSTEQDPDATAPGAIFICQDVTRERELLQASRALEGAAVQASAAKSLFLATLSHEIRTPLNGCLGMMQLALEVPGLPLEGEDCIQKALQSAAILQSMISSVLDWTLMEAGKLILKESNFDLREMISSSVSMFLPKAALKGINLRVSFSDDFPMGIVSDCDRLRQVLLNITSNAVKYSDKGDVVVEARVAGQLEAGPGGPRARLHISVSDQGRGIRREDLAKLFQIFSRVVGPGEPDPGGTGLGLAISKKLVNLLGGEIGVASTEGSGSTFFFEFPATLLASSFALSSTVEPPQALDPIARRLPAAASAVAIALSRKRRSSSPAVLSASCDPHKRRTLRGTRGHMHGQGHSQPNVLLVDDNAFNLQVGTKMLQALGCNVTTACDGVEAVEKTMAMQPNAVWDICFMDIMMPRKNGLQATREIRSWQAEAGAPPMPIVALTAHTTSECKEDTISAGFDAYLTKPVAKKDFAELLARHCHCKMGARCVDRDAQMSQVTMAIV